MQPDPSKNPEVQQLTQQTETLLAVGTNYRVTSAADYEVAGLELKRVKDAQKKLDDLRKSMTRPIDAAKKAIMDFFRSPEQKLATAESGIKRAMIAYTTEQDRIRREQQAKAEEAAAKERARLQKIADEAAAKARAEQERLQREAQAAAAAGRAAEAAKLAAQAVKVEEKAAAKVETFEQRASMVVAPVIQREAPKVAGISGRENWKAECVDLKALVKAVAEGRAPLSLVMANDKVLNAQARSLKADFVADGVRVWSEKNLAAGAA